jgi:hypothetical protein
MMKVGDEEVKKPKGGWKKRVEYGFDEEEEETEGNERKDGVAEEEEGLGFPRHG